MGSVVQVHPDPPRWGDTRGKDRARRNGIGGCSSAGRAPALQAGGQEFDPPQLHQMDAFKITNRHKIFLKIRLIGFIIDLVPFPKRTGLVL